MSNYTQKTGRVEGHWVEYEETPPGHGTGYFWLRSDGLRFGYRVAGEYYRPGTTHEAVESPRHPYNLPRNYPNRQELIRGAPAGSYFDGAVAFDVFGAMREEAKMESLPSHLRVMRDSQEVELISQIDGVDLEVALRNEEFNPFDFIDKRFPIERTVNATSK